MVAALCCCCLQSAPVLTFVYVQYIVKPPKCCESAFKWHRDSDWCSDHSCSCYISLWCALDDSNIGRSSLVQLQISSAQFMLKNSNKFHVCMLGLAENGCLLIQPVTSPDQGESTAVSLPVKSGTLIVMDDQLLHCSHPNMSNKVRRAWMPQFSSEPVVCKQSFPVSLAVPFL